MTQYATEDEARAAAANADPERVVVPETENPVAEERTFEEYRQAQLDEYNKYVAVHPIFIGGARAYSPGHQVSTSQVVANQWLEMGLVTLASDSEAE